MIFEYMRVVMLLEFSLKIPACSRRFWGRFIVDNNDGKCKFLAVTFSSV